MGLLGKIPWLAYNVTLSAKGSLILGENKAGFRRESHIIISRLKQLNGLHSPSNFTDHV